MRTFLTLIFAFSAPITMLADEETPAPTLEMPAEEAAFPEKLTVAALLQIADEVEELSRQRLVSGVGGRETAEARRVDSLQTNAIADQIKAAATELKIANLAKSGAEEQLAKAESHALRVTEAAAADINNENIASTLNTLLAVPEALPPQPVTHIFCMEAAGAGPRTFARFAKDSLTESLPYVQGYITHELTQIAPYKIRLRLIVEHDATAAPFGTLDALHAANKAAVDQMDDPDRRPSETILMGELAERLCATTPANP